LRDEVGFDAGSQAQKDADLRIPRAPPRGRVPPSAVRSFSMEHRSQYLRTI
jgi:hypothetical protein